MCHVGGVLGCGAYAGKKDEVHAAWRANMAELATCPNVSVKLGGMLNRGAALNFRELAAPLNSAAWSAAWRPYVEPCIELFGAERCNFESNFPVDKMGTGYATLWNAFKRITAGCSHTEKLALYSDTRSSSTISTEARGIAEPRYSFPKFVATLCLSPQSRRIPHWLYDGDGLGDDPKGRCTVRWAAAPASSRARC